MKERKFMVRILERIQRKTASHADWWSDYMTELSILVISLAATFYGENLIQGYLESQEDHQTMELVVQELENNRMELAEMQTRYYAKSISFARVLEELNPQDTTLADTLSRYTDFYGTLYHPTLKNTALDIMKISGTMQRMEDKVLLMKLLDSYERLNLIKELDKDFTKERSVKVVAFNERLKEGVSAIDMTGQWRQIAEDEDFKRYLLVSAPSAAWTINQLLSHAKEDFAKVAKQIRESYDIRDTETRPSD